MDFKWITEWFSSFCVVKIFSQTTSPPSSSSWIKGRVERRNMSTISISSERVGKNLLLQVCNRIYLLSCVIGFLYQISMISSEYFSYQVSSDLFIQIPIELNAPDTSICVRYSDVFNVKEYSRRNGIKIHEKTGSTSLKYKLGKIVTIQDIFNYTPSVKEVISSCLIRLPKSYGYKAYKDHHRRQYDVSEEESDCEKLFHVNKFYTQDEVCYMFTLVPSQQESYQYHNLGQSLSKPGEFYKIILSGAFNPTRMGKIVIHKSSWTPFTSISFAPSFNTESIHKEWRSDWNNKFYATYIMFSQQRLPPPYDSYCLNYQTTNMVSRSLCLKNCITESTLKEFNLVPFSSIGLEPINKRHITTLYLYKNSTAENLLDQLEDQCKLKCFRMDCNNTYFMTKLIPSLTSLERDGLSVVTTAPRSASYIITNSPSSSLTEYLVYVSSCLGIWFGFSFMDLNPFSLKGRGIKNAINSLWNSFQILLTYPFKKDGEVIEEKVGRRENLITKNYLRRRNLIRRNPTLNGDGVNELQCYHLKCGHTECDYCLTTSRLISASIKGEKEQFVAVLKKDREQKREEMKIEKGKKKWFCF